MYFKFTVSSLLLSASLSFAATLVVPVSVDDRQWDGDGIGKFVGQTNVRVGMDSAGDGTDLVLPFQLPVIPVGEVIVSATLTVNQEGYTSFATMGDAMLYGLGTTSASSATSFAAHYVEGANPSGNADATLIDASFIDFATAIPSSGGVTGLSNTYSGDITSFVTGLYGTGTAGDFGFLTLAVDITTVGNSANNYYLISTANSGTASAQPVVTIETAPVPEPSAAIMILTLGMLSVLRRRN